MKSANSFRLLRCSSWIEWISSRLASGKRRRRRNRSNAIFETLEPRRLLAAVTNSIDVYEGDTAYVSLDFEKQYFLSRGSLQYSQIEGDATLELDYSVDAGFLPSVPGGGLVLPIQFKADSLAEGSESFVLSIQFHYLDVLTGRPTYLETLLSGRISDPVVSVSTIEGVASETPSGNLVPDEATIRFSLEAGHQVGSVHAFFITHDPSGTTLSENLADANDWYFDQSVMFVGYKNLVDLDVPDSKKKVAVYSVQIPRDDAFLDVKIYAKNDRQFEPDELSLIALVDEFDFDFEGKPITHKALYAIGQEMTSYSIVDRTADIDVNGMDDLSEDHPGVVLNFNGDDDNGNGVADIFDVDLPEGYQFVDDDLLEVSIRSLIPENAGFENDTFTLDFDRQNLRIWFKQDKSEREGRGPEVTSETVFSEADGNQSLWIEGVGLGAGKVDLVWNDNRDLVQRTAIFDSFRYLVWGIDVDVDSDNDGIIERDAWEEELEDSEFGLGVILGVGTLTKVVIDLPPRRNLEDATITIDSLDYESGLIRVWTDAYLNKQLISGHTYPLSVLELDERSVTIYLEGVKDSAGHKTLVQWTGVDKPSDFVTVTLRAGERIATDRVQYLVSTKPSFVWNLARRPELRSALASQLVYDQISFEHYALKRLSNEELREAGIKEIDISFLNENGGAQLNGRPSGFKASLYRDYAATDSGKFILAFAGTDMTDLDDWITNVSQGVRSGSNSYTAAALLGYWVPTSLMEKGIRNVEVSVAGHSLGGGLASAAAVYGRLKGHTFNSAGLHLGTVLFSRMTDRVDGEPRYSQDQVKLLYDEAKRNLTHYHNNADILTILQRAAGIQPAIGIQSPSSKGPHDQNSRIGVTERRITEVLSKKIVEDDLEGRLYLEVGELAKDLVKYYALEDEEFDETWADWLVGITIAAINGRYDYESLLLMAEGHGHYIHGLLGEELFGGFDE